MPVVIGEFETVAETRPAQQGAGDTAPQEESGRPERIEPCALASVQRELTIQSLRVWAH
jgi:hypothetical protein